MNDEVVVFQRRVGASCDLDVLLGFARNAMCNDRSDLARVALERVRQVFGERSVRASLVDRNLMPAATELKLVKASSASRVAWRKVNRGGYLMRRAAKRVALQAPAVQDSPDQCGQAGAANAERFRQAA